MKINVIFENEHYTLANPHKGGTRNISGNRVVATDNNFPQFQYRGLRVLLKNAEHVYIF